MKGEGFTFPLQCTKNLFSLPTFLALLMLSSCGVNDLSFSHPPQVAAQVTPTPILPTVAALQIALSFVAVGAKDASEFTALSVIEDNGLMPYTILKNALQIQSLVYGDKSVVILSLNLAGLDNCPLSLSVSTAWDYDGNQAHDRRTVLGSISYFSQTADEFRLFSFGDNLPAPYGGPIEICGNQFNIQITRQEITN